MIKSKDFSRHLSIFPVLFKENLIYKYFSSLCKPFTFYSISALEYKVLPIIFSPFSTWISINLLYVSGFFLLQKKGFSLYLLHKEPTVSYSFKVYNCTQNNVKSKSGNREVNG